MQLLQSTQNGQFCCTCVPLIFCVFAWPILSTSYSWIDCNIKNFYYKLCNQYKAIECSNLSDLPTDLSSPYVCGALYLLHRRSPGSGVPLSCTFEWFPCSNTHTSTQEHLLTSWSVQSGVLGAVKHSTLWDSSTRLGNLCFMALYGDFRIIFFCRLRSSHLSFVFSGLTRFASPYPSPRFEALGARLPAPENAWEHGVRRNEFN